MPRYIRVYDVPPPGESIVVGDLDDRTPIPAGEVPSAEWDVEREDGTIARMTTQQILDHVSTSKNGIPSYATHTEFGQYTLFVFQGQLYRVLMLISSTNTRTVAQLLADGVIERLTAPDGEGQPGPPGNPAEIEIEDTSDGIRVRGKSGDEVNFGAWHEVRDGRDGRNGSGGGSKRTARGMTPFALDGMQGRRYGPMLPFNVNGLGGMRPYAGDPMDNKPSGTPMTGRFPRKRQSAEDVLRMFDGVPELVADYMWDLIMDRIPAPTQLRDADDTYELIRARIEGYVTGYTEAFSSALKSKLEGVEEGATQDQTDTEILNLLLGLSVNDRGRLRQGISAQVQGSYAPGSTISATAANVLTALEGIPSTQEQQARTAIQALGRDITVDSRSEGEIRAHIYIVANSNGLVRIGSGTYNLQSGESAVGIDFAGGVI